MRVLRMPQVGGDAVPAVLAAWFVDVGSPVTARQPVVALDTAESLVTIEAPRDGVLLQVLVEPGAPVAPGTALAVLGDPVRDPSGASAAEDPGLAPGGEADVEPVPPLVRRVARSIDLPGARVPQARPAVDLVARVHAALAANDGPTVAAAASPPAALTLVPDPTGESATVGERPPPFTGCARVPAGPVLALLAELRAERERIPQDAGPEITLQHLMVKAVADALHQSTQPGDPRVSTIGVAFPVTTDGGVVTPVVREPRSMTVRTLAASMADLARRARTGSLAPDELAAGGVPTVADRDSPRHLADDPGLPGLVVRAATRDDGADSALLVSVTHGTRAGGPDAAAAAARLLGALLDVLQRPFRLLV